MQRSRPGHLFEAERLTSQVRYAFQPICRLAAGGVEAYTVDHRPIWLRSAASLRVEETMTCDEFSRKASRLDR